MTISSKMENSHLDYIASSHGPFEHERCLEVYLYRRQRYSVRSTARLFVESSLSLGRVDLDFPFQQWALRIGDHYYEATTTGLNLIYRHYDHTERETYGWVPESNYKKTRLGCTELGHVEVHERGVYQ